ncbi:hemolysin III family protein [Actinocorallia sp. API 0066]|uniref:PAQR family membrane homeostasis protein TrhA n=1 Tax=Actinocorallia sp. API 0066 TaxID=2896846 RepID=UPI001E3C24B9|nr:hemolysin III family protein [Actinocorallia sp. API 0066]MCD0453618.1 hemolysin III family protein [Actinocorallia sp. API 0066]
MVATLERIADAQLKPRLRGWLHLGAFPAALIGGLVLVTFGPTLQSRIGAAVYAVTSGLLFGISATYHRNQFGPRGEAAMRRFDHANIFLIIAGTYTPFALLALEGTTRIVILAGVWTGAIAGVIFRTCWLGAPRWLATAAYIALGWFAVIALPDFLTGAGIAASVLIVVGGALYSAGGVIYARKRPDPSPRWFGFHEVFHAFTIAAYVCHYVAVSLVVYRA